jgi:hypothetical protein
MRTRTWFVLATTISLAACGGGGSSGSVPSGSNQQSSTQDVAQAGMQAASSSIEQGDLASSLVDGTTGSTPAVSRALSISFDGVCHNGKEFFKTVDSSSQTTYESKYFYDAACTEIARDVVSVVTTSSGGEQIQRTAKNYTVTAALLSTRSSNYAITGSASNYSAVATSSLFIGTDTQPDMQSAWQWTDAPQSASVNTISGDHAHIDNEGMPTIDESYGHTGVLSNGTETFDSSGDVTYAGQLNRTFYKAPLDALVLSATPPFGITGGTQLGTSQFQGSVEFDSTGDLIGVQITGTMLSGNTLKVTSSGSPLSVTGTITSPSNATVATFEADQYGDGTITYADGSQALIVDWHITK